MAWVLTHKLTIESCVLAQVTPDGLTVKDVVEPTAAAATRTKTREIIATMECCGLSMVWMMQPMNESNSSNFFTHKKNSEEEKDPTCTCLWCQKKCRKCQSTDTIPSWRVEVQVTVT
jgi:hypothetical protein